MGTATKMLKTQQPIKAIVIKFKTKIQTLIIKVNSPQINISKSMHAETQTSRYMNWTFLRHPLIHYSSLGSMFHESQ